MDQETDFVIYEGVVVPESALFKRRNRYGSIEDLPDEELADPDELERTLYREEWGPAFLLPKPKRYNPAWDRSVDVDFDATASVDFERTQPKFDKARYKADKLEEERKDVLIMVALLDERIKSKAKYKLFRYVLSGIIDVDDIRDWDMWQFAKYCLRSVRLKEQIKELREKSRQRRQEEAEAVLRSMGW